MLGKPLRCNAVGLFRCKDLPDWDARWTLWGVRGHRCGFSQVLGFAETGSLTTDRSTFPLSAPCSVFPGCTKKSVARKSLWWEMGGSLELGCRLSSGFCFSWAPPSPAAHKMLRLSGPFETPRQRSRRLSKDCNPPSQAGFRFWMVLRFRPTARSIDFNGHIINAPSSKLHAVGRNGGAGER